MNKCFVFLLLLSLPFIACKNEVKKEVNNAPESFLRIVYNVLIDEETDDYDFFIMDFDGSNVQNICRSPGVDWAYYTYNDKIYFLSDRDTCYRCFYLYETDVYGLNIRKVSDIRLRDSWMSSRNDGAELIVSPHKSVDSCFLVINLEGELLSRICPDLPYINDPYFSPDGNQVVFRGSKDLFKEDAQDVDELYIINTDGTGLRQITHFPEGDSLAEWHNYHAGPPEWNAGTNMIYYISRQNGNYSIFQVDPFGKSNKKLSSDGFNQGWHSVSPDGSFIVFNGSSLKQDSNYDIYMMDNIKRQVVRLTRDTLNEQAPLFVKQYQ